MSRVEFGLIHYFNFEFYYLQNARRVGKLVLCADFLKVIFCRKRKTAGGLELKICA